MTTTLLEEHALLGAQMAPDDACPAVLGYGDPEGEVTALRGSCGLCDLSGAALTLVAGPGASRFGDVAIASAPLMVGECAPGAVLAGDGALTGIPLAMRTGDGEVLLFDASPRSDTVFWWVGWLASMEQGGVRPFDDASVEDHTGDLVPLALIGPGAPEVLGDYLGAGQPLPEPGGVSSPILDQIRGVICAHVPTSGSPAFLLLVPPRLARALWRSFLSFEQVTPVGGEALGAWAVDALPWSREVAAGGRIEVAAQLLVGLDVARPEGGFVGARALGI